MLAVESCITHLLIMSDFHKKSVRFSAEIRKKEFFEVNVCRNEKFQRHVKLFYEELLNEMLINKQKNFKLLIALNIARNYE